jgi:alkanesulfonate monooxygenase SsuD/methylene tetrahydromethanopterin reductase-like flavin-dependent oxidoreductase (luciferase family)
MKFDLLYELQIPKPHDERSEWRCYHEALEQIELADRLGYDTVWEVEHHFLTEFAHSSAPEVFLAAVSQRTKNIRIGHGVTLLPYKFNHPIRVAERVAALDIVSNGRVEFGTGRSSQFEQAGFEIDTAESRDMWQESLEIIPRMWTESPFEYAGKYVKHPAARHPPKPVQKPHPPIWAAATSPATWELAGKNGIGILGLTIFVSVAQLADRVKAYKAALKDAKPVGKFVNDKVGAFTIVHVAETREEAIANGAADAAINYLLYAFRVLGGFADPVRQGHAARVRRARDQEHAVPRPDLEGVPAHREDAEGRVYVRGARRRGHGHRRRRRPRDPQGREVQGRGPRPSALAHAGGSRAAPGRDEVHRPLREARDAALPVRPVWRTPHKPDRPLARARTEA